MPSLRRRFLTFVRFVSFVVAFSFLFTTPTVRAATAAATATSPDLEIIRVWPGWREAESFERISEYFTGQENSGARVVLRTHTDIRAGYYFLVRIKNPGPALAGAKFALHVIAPTAPETKTYLLPVTLASGETVFDLGLTGADWADKKSHPVAWKLELLDADGHALTTLKSFLWEKPAK